MGNSALPKAMEYVKKNPQQYQTCENWKKEGIT